MTREEAVRRARGLAPAIRERAPSAEAARRMVGESVDECRSAGLFRTLRPLRWGGHEISFDAAADVAIEISRACGSTGWCVSLLSFHDWLLARFPDAAQHDVWGADPDALLATSVAPMGKATRVQGGYRVAGEWAWLSGVDFCNWVAVHAVLAPGEVVMVLVPSADYSIRDTWFNVGLRGTGSNNVILDDVFVPTHRAMPAETVIEGPSRDSHRNDNPLYAQPLVACFLAALAFPALGIAQGAYADWLSETAGRRSTFGRALVGEQLPVQLKLTDAAMRIAAGEKLLRDNLDRVRGPRIADTEDRAIAKCQYAFAVNLLVEAVDGLMAVSGARGLFDSNSLQRAWRDVHSIAQHRGLNLDIAREAFARHELGLGRNPGDPVY